MQLRNPYGVFTVGRARDLGIDAAPGQPWATVCEKHSNFITSRTEARAVAAAAYPEWCGDHALGRRRRSGVKF